MVMAPYRELLDAHKGRCAVASRPLRAGCCILRTSAVCAVSSSSCGWCFRSQVPLQRCTGCRTARYCSRACQQRDWAQHRRECAAWCSTPAARTSPTVLLVTRLAAKLFLGSETSMEEKDGVLKLRHHWDDHTELKRRQFHDMTQLVLLLLSRYKGDKKLQIPSFEQLQSDLEPEILKLFGRVNCNAFSIANDVTNEAVGIGLFPDGALFNHDCDPNCVVSFTGREMRIHVVKDVAADQELTVSYVELLQATSARRNELKSSYFFDCECARCQAATKREANEDSFLDGLSCSKECEASGGVMKLEPDRSDAVCKRCGAVRSGEDLARCEQELKSIDTLKTETEESRWEAYQQKWEIATHRLGLHPRNARVAVLAREIGNFLMDAASLRLQRKAIGFFLAELQAVEWLLPPLKLPSRGLLHFQIGKLLFEEVNTSACTVPNATEQIQQAAKHLQEALSVLACAYGSSSAAVQSAQLMLDEVQRTSRAFP